MPQILPTVSEPVVFAPLPLPQAHPELKPIRRGRPRRNAWPAAPLMPLLYTALLYLAGIVLAHRVYLRPGLLLASLPALAAVALTAILRAPRVQWVALAALWLMLGAWSGESEQEPAPNSAIVSLSDGLLRTVEGTVAAEEPVRGSAQAIASQDSDPTAEADPGANSNAGQGQLDQQVDLQVAAIEIVSDAMDGLHPIPKISAERVRLAVHWPRGSSPQQLRCGERLRAVVRLETPETFHDPGVWDRAAYLAAQQISATASLNAARQDGGEPRLQVLAEPTHRSFSCWLNQFRNRAANRLQDLPAITGRLPQALHATPADAAMLTALLTGDRSLLNRNLRVGFERTGSFHLIVVSGLHLAILAGCVFALARRLRLGRGPATLPTLAIALAYALFTGFAVPVQRSFWMVALYLIGRLLYRDRSALNVLGFAVLCLAAASPRSIFDASFQMTILAVGSIAGLAAPLLETTLHARVRATKDLRLIGLDVKLPPRIAQFRVTLRMLCKASADASGAKIFWTLLPAGVRLLLRSGELIFVTLVVELALALPMAMYFHRITVFALPVNLCILPLLGLLLPAAMAMLLTLVLWPAAAILPAAGCLFLLHLGLFVIRRLGTLALADFRIPEPSAVEIAAALVLFLIALQLARLRTPRFSALGRPLALAAIAGMAVCAVFPRPVNHPANALLFEAIDVGQGDALLLISPEGKTLLVDSGGLGLPFPGSHGGSRTPDAFDTGEEIVSAVLWSRGIRRLDAVALTHAHHDHMGGMPAILRNFRPHEFWVGENPPTGAYRDLLREADSLGIALRRLHAGEFISLGEIPVQVLAPARSYHPGAEPANNDSLVLRARYGKTSVLLAGDAEAPEEQGMLAAFDLQSTVLKVGHHGSRTSTRPAFLAAVEPAWAVISCGRHNRFGHPRIEVLRELQAAHIRTFRTDLNGAACFSLDGSDVHPDAMCGQNTEHGP